MADTPRRIQLSRAKGWRMPENTVKVDRATGFGNPFPVSKAREIHAGGIRTRWAVGSWSGPAMWFVDDKQQAQEMSAKAFRAWLDQPPQSGLKQRAVMQLRGKNLACWCALDQPCHADVLLEMANAPACEAVTP